MLVPLLGLGVLVMTGAAGCSCSSGAEGDADATAGANVGGAGGAGGGGEGGAGGGGAGGDDGGMIGNGSSGANTGGSGPVTPDTACVATVAEATLTKRPVDIVFVIDNSPSMANEIISVQNNINESFASIIGESGIDYRVIMISAHGAAEEDDSICVGAPLSTESCSPVPEAPGNNPPVFYHYSHEIRSNDALCVLLGSYNGGLPDEHGVAPSGWSEWVREDSFKVITVITDDHVGCQSTHLPRNIYIDDTRQPWEDVATDFEELLFGLDPAVFGDATAPNYVFHSIVGLHENTVLTDAYAPDADVVEETCGTAVAPGTGYQTLSKRTGGLRFPLCQTDSYDVVFQAIAEGVITGAVVACEFEVPDSPPGEIIDLSTVVVQYTPGDGSEPQSFDQVASAAACAPGSFYIENDMITLCPDACRLVQDDAMAAVDVLYGCDPEPAQ
ncbi:hypothetical protein WME73_34645 [Sorangium sp. So ce302]|uniref:hypothetical protein n=1 Tax=Sorangium sp. So ce302 TaxID=3133297 RepID=UPI003F618A72